MAKLPQGGQNVDVEFEPLGASRIDEEYLQQVSGQIKDIFMQVLDNSVGQVFYHYRPAFGRTTFVPKDRRRESRRLRIARGIFRAAALALQMKDPSISLEEAVADWAVKTGQPGTLKNIINVLRHRFTNYDRVWRSLEALHSSDRCGFIRAFHQLTYEAQRMVDQIIDELYAEQPPLVGMLKKFNQQWADAKIKHHALPPNC